MNILVIKSWSLIGLPVNISYLIGKGLDARLSVIKFLFLIELPISEPNSLVYGVNTLPNSFLKLLKGKVLFAY